MNAIPGGSILVRDMEEAMQVIRRLDDPATKVVGYDSETTGLKWVDNYIIGHVITFSPSPQDTFYIPVRHGEAGVTRDANILPGHQYKGTKPRDGVEEHPFEVEFNKVSNTRRDLHWFGHNFQFDMMFNYGHGVEFIGTMEDTQTNAALLNEHQFSFSLDNCCKIAGTQPKLGEDLYRYLAATFGGEATKAQMAHFWRLAGDDTMGVDYATGDGVSTWSLRDRQLEMLQAQDLMRPWQAECDVLRVIHRMQKRGIRIDVAKLHSVIEYAQEKERKAKEALPDEFNVRSAPAIRKLFEKSGITNWPLASPTKLMILKAQKLGIPAVGNPQFNEAFLKSTELGRSIIDVRKYSNIVNSFAIPLRDRHLHFDGRVRATFHAMRADDFGTVTGRFSCSEPNLQQVPKRNKELAALFRQVFLPDEGMQWWDADLSQCEPRLLAHYSRAKVLMEGYLSVPHVDAHQSVANAARIDREDGKRLNQTLITGGGLRRIQDMLGATHGAEVYDQYFKALPEIKILQKAAARRLLERGYVISLLGRRCRLDNSQYAYKAVNKLLQTGNADIIKDAMIKIDRHLEATGDKVNMLVTIHDALAFQAHQDTESQQIVTRAVQMMADYGPGKTVNLGVPMGCEYGIGANWSEATFPKEKHYVQ